MYNSELVSQMPVNTLEELTEKEKAEDYNMLLNESWEHYARRVGIIDSIDINTSKRTKWLTETWDENQERKRRQEVYIELKMQEMSNQNKDSARQQRARDAVDEQVVQILMCKEEQAHKLTTPSRHYLFTDFVKLQQEKFAAERCTVIASEAMTRSLIELGVQMTTELLTCYKSCQIAMCVQREKERLEAEQEERRRCEEEERLRQVEEARLQKERERCEEERIRRAREEAEMNKRLERKRRDEERRARVRGTTSVKAQIEKEEESKSQ